MKIYRGVIAQDRSSCRVDVRDTDKPRRHPQPLPLYLEVRNLSPTGFAWGFAGSGASQLALALLCDAIGPERAVLSYQAFKRDRIHWLKSNVGWEITLADILTWLERRRHAPPSRDRSPAASETVRNGHALRR